MLKSPRIWYPGLCEIYPLQEIVRETSRFFKETANIIHRHSGAFFWLYWNTQLLVDFPVVDTLYLLQYKYNHNEFLAQYVQVYGQYI